MINPLTFILNDPLSCGGLPSEENIFYSIRINPLSAGALKNAYTFLSHNTTVHCCLTLEITDRLTPESIRDIAAFFFIPAYLHVGNRAWLHLSGADPQLTDDAGARLTAYLTSQGIIDPVLLVPDPAVIFDNADTLIAHYGDSLPEGAARQRILFFNLPAGMEIGPVISALHDKEYACRRNNPDLYALLTEKRELERQLLDLRIRQTATEAELANQRQYLAVLRSHHATKELQDFYDNEYEVLPLWYKRFGHIIKVFAGKRTFRSLFRDDVKKYKD